MEQISKMNKDLTGILRNFPEGIVLYDNAKKNIVLANTEFKKIFRCSLIDDDQDALAERLN